MTSYKLKPIEKALKLRKTLYLRSKEPKKAFYNRLKKPKKILDTLENSGLQSPFILEARRHYLVCLACAYEIFWRELIKYNVNHSSFNSNDLKKLNKVNFTLSDVADIFHHNLTLGELVSSAYSFQGIDHVNKAVSDLLQIDAFAQFRNANFQLRWSDPKSGKIEQQNAKLGEEALRRTKYINYCFEVRHEVVHDTGTRFKVSKRKISYIEGALDFFNSTFGIFVNGLFESRK